MNFIEWSTFIIGEIYVLLFAMLFGALPGRKYYEKYLITIQLTLTSIAMAVGVALLIYVKNATGLRDDDKGIVGPLVFLCVLFFGGSIYRFLDRKKHGDDVSTISLKKEDYELRKDFEFLLGDYLLMPNVSCYAKVGDEVILFTGARPDASVDADFTCRKLNDKTYECICFDVKNQKPSFKSLFNKITTYSLVAICFAEVYMIQNGRYIDTPMAYHWMRICRTNFGMLIFGGLDMKLFKGSKGIGSKFMYLFGLFFVLMGLLGILIGHY